MPTKKKSNWFKDGGIKSRKMWMAAVTSLLIFIGAGLSARYPAFSPSYETYVGGMVATYLAYCGGNVGAKVANRGQPAAGAPEDDFPDEVKG